MITNNINDLVKALANDQVVAFRTDTVYGLSTNIHSDKAVANIFKLKKRNDGKPLIVLVPNSYDITKLVYVSSDAKKLIDAFWPGPLTIIFKLKGKIARGITTYDTLSLRMPNNGTCNKLLDSYGKPITSTSCNISGEQILNNAVDIAKTFDIPVLDGGICDGGKPSTIVNCAGDKVVILREGEISKEDIYKVLQ